MADPEDGEDDTEDDDEDCLIFWTSPEWEGVDVSVSGFGVLQWSGVGGGTYGLRR